jgi:hypothetical protein
MLFNVHYFQVVKTFVCYSTILPGLFYRLIINILNTRRHQCTDHREIVLEDNEDCVKI